MFIERLTKDDFEEFASLFNCSLNKVLELQKHQIRLDMQSLDRKSYPQFYLTDFDCKTTNYYDDFSQNTINKWYKFLYQKFSNEYLDAFKDYFMKKQNILIEEMTK